MISLDLADAASFGPFDTGQVTEAEAAQSIRRAYEAERARLFEDYAQAPRETRDLITKLSEVTDRAVIAAFRHAASVAGQFDENGFAIIAVGGCGRREMAPFSDVDLLFLKPDNAPGVSNDVIERTLYMLWDMKLKVGHATRTVSETFKLASDDITIRTSVLENRLLFGDEDLFRALNSKLREQLFSKTASEFVEQKLAERDSRHKRQSGARYVLEPNVKEGKGGLRDLQTLFWIAKYVSGSETPEELVQKGYFTKDEIDAFTKAETFLWTVRCHLHILAKRAVEKLTFDLQTEVAERLGYKDQDGQLAVESFMQVFFLHATKVGDLTRIMLTKLEATHIKARPSWKRAMASLLGQTPVDTTPDGYQIEDGRLNISDEATFLASPLNILRLFQEALRSDVLIHPDAMRIVAANLDLITEEVRQTRQAQKIFLGLLLDYGNPERALRRMNELGVLGQFVPEFKRVVAMMQFNFYHHFTVDEHTIQCIAHLSKLEREQPNHPYPLVARILKKGVNRRVLYVALLLHDIGKGLPEPHEIVGEEMARTIAPRLSLDEDETELVAWLVRHHLLMSDVAQKRDLSDPKTVTDFAYLVQSTQRLNLLYVLTICDILGVGPGTLTAWKAELLRQLYSYTRDVFRESGPSYALEARLKEQRQAFAQSVQDWDPVTVESELDRHYPDFWLGLDTDTQRTIALSLATLATDDISISVDHDAQRATTRVCFALQDHPGIFSRLAGAVALAGLNVIDARVYTTKDGFATTVFWVQGQDGKPVADPSRLNRLKTIIRKTLSGELVARDEIAAKDKIAKRERDIQFATEITFDNEGSEIHTILEVDTRDRPGLLYDLTRTLAHMNIQISSATVATFGAQAVDTFYVKDIFGLKIQSPQKQANIAAGLKSAIKAGTRQALPE